MRRLATHESQTHKTNFNDSRSFGNAIATANGIGGNDTARVFNRPRRSGRRVAGAIVGLGRRIARPTVAETAVETVFIVWKCHLDLGFTALASEVERQYFEIYLPQAMDLGEQIAREDNGQSFTWTTGSWLIYEFLERADSTQRARMERAIAQNHIAWHALPHSFQGELMSRDLLVSSLELSRSLDKRFGKATTGAKLTDVPGQTRGLVAPLSQAGVRFLDIGGNPGSAAPCTPPLFRWREPGGAELCVLHHAGYGQTLAVPGSKFALCINVSNDNGGVPTRDELRDFMAQLQTRFPRARLQMASLSDMALALETVRAQLPVWAGEIGDTWIHGAGSDPRLIAQSRELQRLHAHWLKTGVIKCGDAHDLAFARRLTLFAEHTWGLDIKTFLKDQSYQRADFESARADATTRSQYELVESSWAQKRARVAQTLELLPAELKNEAEKSLDSLQVAGACARWFARVRCEKNVGDAPFPSANRRANWRVAPAQATRQSARLGELASSFGTCGLSNF